MAPVLSVLTRNRDFRYLFLAELVVFGGDWFALIPLIGLLHDLTGSGLPGALALAADTAVNALLLPFAGAVADRLRPPKDHDDGEPGRDRVDRAAVRRPLARSSPSSARSRSGWPPRPRRSTRRPPAPPCRTWSRPRTCRPPTPWPAAPGAPCSWSARRWAACSTSSPARTSASPSTVACLLVAAGLVWRVRRPMQAARTGAPRTRGRSGSRWTTSATTRGCCRWSP